ncbi:ankyrin repeat protein, partial [Elysia marginata]
MKMTPKRVKFLVQHGADPNVKTRGNFGAGWTPAMSAAERGFLICLRFLVESGADLSLTSICGQTALTLAAKNARLDCVKYLTQHMSDTLLNHRVYRDIETALMKIVSCYISMTNEHLLCLEHLIDIGADLNIRSIDDETVLMIALRRNHTITNAVELLLKKGAEIHAVTNYGATPLTLAVCRKNTKGISLLIESGADVNRVSDNGASLLKHATNNSMLTLLRNGLDPTMTCRHRGFLHEA